MNQIDKYLSGGFVFIKFKQLELLSPKRDISCIQKCGSVDLYYVAHHASRFFNLGVHLRARVVHVHMDLFIYVADVFDCFHTVTVCSS